MKSVNIILMGFGNVGRAFLQILLEKKSLCRERFGLGFRVHAIFKRAGALFSPQSLEIEAILGKLSSQVFEGLPWKPNLKLKDVLGAIPPGVLVECTSSNIKTGEPGLSVIRRALENRWNVVTANKGPLVVDYKDLMQLARQNQVHLKLSGATAAALPTLDVGFYSLAGAEILGIEGILNGTTNFILTKMGEGADYEAALKEAQAKGIAEPDPSLDVEGWDTASKILLISNAILGTDLVLSDVKVQGITQVPASLIPKTKKEGKSLKLLGRLYKEENNFRIEVVLVALDNSHPLFAVRGANKGIVFDTDTMGSVVVTGGKSDPKAAGAALLKDIINIYREDM